MSYDKFPRVKISEEDNIIIGNENIAERLKKLDNNLLILECYPSTDIESLEKNLLSNFPNHERIFIDDLSNSEEEIDSYVKRNITEDRVFGFMSNHQIEEFYPQYKIDILAEEIVDRKVIVYGFGAVQLHNNDAVLVYVNMARWEIQKRLRSGFSNWKANNHEEDAIRKFKRGYFFEWRVADRIKKRFCEKFDFILDQNEISNVKLLDGYSYRKSLKKVIETPFRLVPFFDPGVWGGQWMKHKFDLDPSAENYAWSFDGVVEENSLHLEFGENYIEIPAIDVVLFEPEKLLGASVHARFGTEFPIRFDFLDTVEGQNLSLQVHPLTEYIQENFGMNYTQDESYYILDKKKDSDTYVYLGVKTGINKKEMLQNLKDAQNGKCLFDDEKYINKIACEKHDHFLIPAGTIHCSGKDTMVLEISATPYIFTFKLWDWDRVGMDDKPRPIHLEHGEKVIDFEKNTQYVQQQLVNQFTKISEVEERTGLHEREFIETRRFFSENSLTHQTNGIFHMLNLIEGEAAIISSPQDKFEDYEVHYAETFIIPANIAEYVITPKGNYKIGYMKAYVRGNNEL